MAGATRWMAISGATRLLQQHVACHPSHRAFTTLPIIDIAALRDPSAVCQRACITCPNTTSTQSQSAQLDVARRLDQACRDVGFFYITNHGVPPSVHEGVLHAARQWFMLPATLKNQIAISPATAFRGFQALGENVTRYQGGFQRDWHEAIDLYKEVCVCTHAGKLTSRGLPLRLVYAPATAPGVSCGAMLCAGCPGEAPTCHSMCVYCCTHAWC